MSFGSDLPAPVTEAGRAGLARILDDPAGALLAVDYDGVLAPIVPDPTKSPPLPGVVAALARVAALIGSVAVISGRPVAVVRDYCRFEREPALDNLVIFGHYGLQRWDARTGEITSPPPPAGRVSTPRATRRCSCCRSPQWARAGSRIRAAGWR